MDEDALGMSECADSCGATWNANSVGTATKMSLTRMKSPTLWFAHRECISRFETHISRYIIVCGDGLAGVA